MPERKKAKRALTITLQSTAAYTRPTRDAPFAGLPVRTVYQETLTANVSDKAAQADRCVASIRDKKRANMILDSIRTIPLERIDQLRDEANEANAEETARMLATRSAQDEEGQTRMLPQGSEAMAAFHATLASEAKHTLAAGIVKEFFQAGGLEGPFPGSRSEQGMVLAGAYWVGSRPGKYMTHGVSSKYMPDGRKYNNPNFL